MLAIAGVIAAGQLVATAPQIVVAQGSPTTTSPQLYVTPECLSGQTSLSVTGRNFDRNRSVNVWDLYNTTDPLYGNKVNATANDYGALSLTLPIDLHQSGWHRVEAVYADDSTFTSQVTVIVADCDPRVVATPKCTSAPTSVDVALTGWDYTSSYAVSVEIDNVSSGAVVATASYDATSSSFSETISFNASVYPNGLPNGQYRISAYQNTDIQGPTTASPSYLLVPCPKVTVTPNCDAKGTPPDELSLDVTASGFINDPDYGLTFVEIVFDDGGSPQEFYTDGSSSDGTYQITPYKRPDGKYAVTVKQGYYQGSEYVTVNSIVLSPAWTGRRWSSATTSFIVPCAQATPPPTPSPSPSPSPSPTAASGPTSLSVSPTCGAPQIVNDTPLTYSLTVIGEGFLPGPLFVTFDPSGTKQVFGAFADATGSFSTIISPAAGAEGSYSIVAHEDVVGAVVPDATTLFGVPCAPPLPQLASDITCGAAAAGTPAAYTINLSGIGFLPGRVEITFDAGGAAPELTVALADANGLFTTTLMPTGRGPGSYAIVAHQQVAGSGTVVDAPPLAFTVACSGAQLVLLPDHGPPGLVIMVAGTNLPPNVDIVLRWDRGIGAGKPIVVHTDADGTLKYQLLIFNSDFLGPRQLSVELPPSPTATVIAPLTYEVTPATVSPPFSLTDDPFALPGETIVFRH